MKKATIKFVVFAVVLAVALSSCNTGKQSGKSESSTTENESISKQNSKHAEDYVIIDNHWKLVELNGKQITTDENNDRKEPFITLNKEDNRVAGNTGCNNLMGSFETSSYSGKDGEISFSQIATTRMACIDVNYEQDFLKALEDCDNYTINNDTLLIKKGNETLASFISVDMQ